MRMRIGRSLTVLAIGVGLTLACLCLLGPGRARASVAGSTIVVNAAADEWYTGSGCSLREAIEAANTDAAVSGCAAGSGDDTVVLPAGVYTLTILPDGTPNDNADGDLDVTDALTITGAGSDDTVINGDRIDRVLDLRPGAGTVVISGVAVLNGSTTGYGGGIYDYDADLILTNSVVASSTAASGGGVYVGYGSATLSGGQIVRNTAGYGGGVFVGESTGALTMTSGSSIAHNTATDTGGGVFVYRGSVTLSGGQIVSNTATMYGGGVGVLETSARFAQTGGSVRGNTATNWGGGGVFVYEGSATLGGGRIISNTANYHGGGVLVYYSSASFTQTGASTIAHNTADSGGGVHVDQGSATLSGGQIVTNTANYDGGGMYNHSGTLTLVNTTVSGNRATGGSGGGLYAGGGTTAITFTTVASNTANSGGYGIHRSAGTVVVHNTIVAHNGTTATNCAGTITSNDYNLEYGDTCGLTQAQDITDTDPLLAPLAYDGGMWVHALLEGSEAIDNGICVAGITTDQRGVIRPEGVTCDIGAYEWIWPKSYLPLALRGY